MFAEAAGAEVEFERLAVIPEQIATYNLPTAPPEATDRRSFSGTATTQAEALPPDILAAIVREAIAAHRDREVHRQTPAREEAERRAIRERLDRCRAAKHLASYCCHRQLDGLRNSVRCPGQPDPRTVTGARRRGCDALPRSALDSP
ncbi:hypothetical protein [Streptomyces sp. NPDC046862]|uniref:hypothetical protein n=1 Tax=Streptomyces sp. NPDC046862 TaxID=3154603 RepID=UPI0034544408